MAGDQSGVIVRNSGAASLIHLSKSALSYATVMPVLSTQGHGASTGNVHNCMI